MTQTPEERGRGILEGEATRAHQRGTHINLGGEGQRRGREIATVVASSLKTGKEDGVTTLEIGKETSLTIPRPNKTMDTPVVLAPSILGIVIEGIGIGETRVIVTTAEIKTRIEAEITIVMWIAAKKNRLLRHGHVIIARVDRTTRTRKEGGDSRTSKSTDRSTEWVEPVDGRAERGRGHSLAAGPLLQAE